MPAEKTAAMLGGLPQPMSASAPRGSRSLSRPFATLLKAIVASAVLSTLLLFTLPDGAVDGLFFTAGRYLDAPVPSHKTATCPQPAPYKLDGEPSNVPLDVLADRLSKAIQIDTTVGDNWPDPVDVPEKWKAFDEFADYLHKTFPRTHESLDLEKVHEHGLLFTWKGSDADLKPLLMMAHQDVVPVNPDTVDEWTHPPFEGYIDRENETVWGRGSTDCKAWLISIMSTVEAMLERGFEPTRTILFSFGFDEESNGPQGAAYLSARIEEIWGKDSIAMLVDEGNPILSGSDPMAPGFSVALPGVEEKGLLDIELTVETQGGHSSAPPPHTSIGLVARAVAALEDARDQLDIHHLIDYGAPLTFLQCIRDAPGFPPKLRAALKDLDWASRSSVLGDSVAPLRSSMMGLDTLVARGVGRLLAQGKERRIRQAKERVVHAMPDALRLPFLTTTAADVIQGGVKLNALPESSTVFFNHRIGTSSGVNELHKHYIKTLKPLAKSFGLELDAFGTAINGTSEEGAAHQGKMTIKHFRRGFEPAPNTPLVGDDAAPWKLFSSIIRSTWKNEDGSPVLVAPAMMQGNTDSRYFANLTKHIFRFGPNTVNADKTGLGAMTGVHTINEHFAIQGLGDAVRFYSTLFQAVGTADL